MQRISEIEPVAESPLVHRSGVPNRDAERMRRFSIAIPFKGMAAFLILGALAGCQPTASTDTIAASQESPADETTASREALAPAEATSQETPRAGAGPTGDRAIQEEAATDTASSGLVDIGSGDLRPSFKSCLDASGGVTPSMQDCIDEEYGFQDDRLNAAYKALMDRTAPSGRDALRDEQRRWIKERDTACSPGERPGQGQILEAGNCEVNATANRALVLEQR
ncbi:lysozyme inhibitor LprI family protein [Luteimonas sp. Y-2-2-4F]|nr:lysozyme inhibitor LprI family protein [Luteimonas sp. Y-2-2-4F]MCD9030244.1 lysozyme inhibitor LprI family protein [Luteimonas sp. Y-2-2-4F]